MQFLTNLLCKLGWHKFVAKPHSIIEEGHLVPYFDGLFDIDDNTLVFGSERCERCDKQSENKTDYLLL
jgi:hypothetical protein